MNNHFYYDHDNPGSGAGYAGNPVPGEMEKKALDKVAGFPGTEQDAAGMGGHKASENDPQNNQHDMQEAKEE